MVTLSENTCQQISIVSNFGRGTVVVKCWGGVPTQFGSAGRELKAVMALSE